MTTGAHLALRDAVVAVLAAAPALADGRVVPARRIPMPVEAQQQIRVWLHASDGQRASTDGRTYQWRTVIAVHCLARSSGGIEAEVRVDALAQAAWARLLASGRLSGTVQDLALERITWEGEELDASVADAVLALAVTHRTKDSLSST